MGLPLRSREVAGLVQQAESREGTARVVAAVLPGVFCCCAVSAAIPDRPSACHRIRRPPRASHPAAAAAVAGVHGALSAY
jgi:hypothetical protein